MRIPKHVAVIPDGNRRWAVSKMFHKKDGYQYGLSPGLSLLHEAVNAGVEELTFYGFTVDNCKRPKAQVDAFRKACVDAVNLIASEPVSLYVLGNEKSPMFPSSLLPFTERTPLNGGGIKVNFLVNYGWEWDLAKLKLGQGYASQEISRIALVIRWGGMQRLSGLLPVQSVYADFYVIKDLWPDYCPSQFSQALEWYAKQDVTLGG